MQTAPAVPEITHNIINPDILGRPIFLRYEKAVIPGKPRTPATPGRSVGHLRQSWRHLTSDFAPGHAAPGSVEAYRNLLLFNQGTKVTDHVHF